MFRILTILFLAASFCFAQTASQSSSPAKAGQQAPALSISPEEMMLLMALLQSPAFKDNFVQSCSAQSTEWLGSAQANKSCGCAFDRLVGDKALLNKVLGAVSLDGKGFDFEKLGFDVVAPCLPEQFPAETDNAFVKECLKQKDLDKATCECMLASVKKDYTVHSLIKTAFENQKKLETDLTLKAAQCLSK